MTSRRRDHLIDTAIGLFNRHGYHATGIDKVLAESGCAKMTLYNHFKSKDELILAALHRRDEVFRNEFMRSVERRAKHPRARLLAVFDVLEDWFTSPDFHGCMFINAMAEYADPEDPIHVAAAESKRLLIGYLETLARAAGAKDPKGLANALALLKEGAAVMAHATGSPRCAKTARKAAAVLIASALG